MFHRRSRGSTLQVLLAVAVIVLLVFIVVPKGCGCQKAPITATQTQIANFKSILDAFREDNGRYPTTEEGLEALLKNPGVARWRGPYLAEKAIPLDSWSSHYQYRLENGRLWIASAGPDTKFGTSDDIVFDSKPLVPWKF